eukprot:Skav213105  [mRNA]  locus=scaffold403:8074:8969:+ [translate_table: standard]
MAANGTNQAILSRALTPEERQRLRDAHNPYRMSSMTWTEWSQTMVSYIFGEKKALCSKDLHSHKVG